MKQWKPWENLELLKSAYYEPEAVKEKDKCDYSVIYINGTTLTDDIPGMLWGRRIFNRDDR